MRNSVLIIPPFFDYPDIIASGLSKVFIDVKLIYLYPTHLLYKVSSFLKLSSLQDILLNRYYKKIKRELKKQNPDVDYFLIVKGSVIPEWFYRWLKSYYFNATFVEYLWDNVKTDPRSLSVSKYYDTVFSFSPEDCAEFGFKYRPFFFVERAEIPSKTIDIACIISFSVDRANILNEILKNNEFLRSRILYWHIKGSRALFLKCKKYIGLLTPFLRTSAVSYAEMNNKLAESKAQIDMPNPNQLGLTTRAFEALATKTKIITTNEQIKNYDFYNKQNILIIDRNNPVIPAEWLDSPYLPLDDEILNYYTRERFISDLIS